MAAGGKLLLRILLLQSFVLGALCFECYSLHPQRQFCDHEYVMKVQIKDPKYKDYNEKWVEIKVIEIFKKNENKFGFKDDKDIYLKMRGYSALDDMKAGDYFLIFGTAIDGGIYTDHCSGSVNWDQTSEILRKGLRSDFKYGCHCQHPQHDCSFCQCKYSYLDDTCNWVQSSEYKYCQIMNPPGTNSGCWL